MKLKNIKLHLGSALILSDYIRHRSWKPVKSAFTYIHDLFVSISMAGKPGFVYFDDLEDYDLEPDGMLICRGNAATKGVIYSVPFHVSNRFVMRDGLNRCVIETVFTKALIAGHRPLFVEKGRLLYSPIGEPIQYDKRPSFLSHRPLRAD